MQRTGDSRAAFVDDLDRRHYLGCLSEMASAEKISLHAYALLTDSVYLLATPATGPSLGLFMQRVNRRYVHVFNRRHGLTGSLWNGRFRAVPIDPEHYLLPAIRFAEQAPVRYGLADAAVDWTWSSAASHTGRTSHRLVVQHPAYWRLGNTPFEREARHEQELLRLLTKEQAAEIYAAAKSGWPIGTPAFLDEIAQTTSRRLLPGSPGRPRR